MAFSVSFTLQKQWLCVYIIHMYACVCMTSQCHSFVQIMAVYGTEDTAIPGDYQGVSNLFTHSLHSATADRPLYLFLDAVDQLSPEDGASGMSWLPLTLPPHVKLVLSTSSEVEYRCFPVLQSLLTKHSGSMVEVKQVLIYIDCDRYSHFSCRSCQSLSASACSTITCHLTREH